ncbi:TnsA-like heteromeric transposase endonuclease subunit [Streptomyces sp. NPDC058202]|uniref:TnsA-like heteromeric transposase endonuclease subunit n=1 Tax=Streptomyces sp. NPDC058202 TaxID=3346380 RepID=UPI0036F16879
MDRPGTCVDLSYVDLVRERPRRPLLDCVTTRFEDVAPVRPIRWSHCDRHFAGGYWAATTGQHVGFESWLERDRLLLLDFDPKVTEIASQPFCLYWHDGERERRHAPDYFARRADGSAVVIHVRAEADRAEGRGSVRVTRLATLRPGGGSSGSRRRRRCCWRKCGGCRATATRGACSARLPTGCGRSSRSQARCFQGPTPRVTGSRRCPPLFICSGSRNWPSTDWRSG